MAMTFSELIDAVRDNPLNVTLPSSWSQGRAGFGGLMAALQYEAMRGCVPHGRPVRSLAVTFVGPAALDIPIAFEAQVLREGKAVSQVLGRAVQDGQVTMLMQGSFGAPRESAVSVAATPAPRFKPVEESQELPFISGMMPEYLKFMEMRWGLGGLPFSNTPSPSMGGYARFRGQSEARPLSEAHILALVDTWPPALLPYLSKPTPASSLTWTIEFIQPQPALTTLDWCTYHVVIEHARDGYGHTAATLWTPAGELVAISRQTVTVFG
jgi:acyl-CoA thioesterase